MGNDQDPGRAEPTAFPADAAEAIRAVVERIVPSGDTPGAREAGTAAYVLHRAVISPAARAAYLRLTARLADAAAAVDPARTFDQLDASAQDAILVALERDGEAAFKRAITDTMEGFYGDPRHGGNAGAVSWANIGFPGPTGGTGYEPPLGWYDANTEPAR